MNPTPPPVSPLPYVPTVPEPTGDSGAGWLTVILGFGSVAFLMWAGLTVLVIWGVYWLIRLAVRHGTMDTARWQATGSVRKVKDARPRSARTSTGSFFEERPRGPRDW